MNYHRVQPYRSVFIAELRSSEFFNGVERPFLVLEGGVELHVAYFVIDDMGDLLNPVSRYFISPLWAMRAADILIDNPKMFEAKVSALLRLEEKFFKEL